MKINELLSEGTNHPVIVVDVQPAYFDYAPKVCNKIVNFVLKQTGPVLMFINADQEGLTEDTKDDVIQLWQDIAVDSEILPSRRVTPRLFRA